MYTGLTWFSDDIHNGICVAELKKECKFVKKLTYYLYHKTLEYDLES